jgi:hypothetical protein
MRVCIAAAILLFLSSSVISVTLPVLDWDGLFSSIKIYDDNVYAGEFECTGNRSGLMSFLVFDIPLSNSADYTDMILDALPRVNVTLFFANGSLAFTNNSFVIEYLRDEQCPSIQPGFDHVFYNGLSSRCNVTLPRGIPCHWLEVTSLVNSTDDFELSIVYDSEERNFTLNFADTKHRFKDEEFHWTGFVILVTASVLIVLLP